MAVRERRVGDKRVNFTPRMSVTGDVKTGVRRMIEYVLSPSLKRKLRVLLEDE